MMSTGLDSAIKLARAAHAGQIDKLAAPYILHPLAVMERVQGAEAKIVAVLHDVIEDSEVTVDDLRERGYSDEVVSAVDAISKRPGEPLAESMARVAANPLAMTVKLADLSHNADPTRQAQLPEGIREQLSAKYSESARLIGTTLEEILAPQG